MNSGSFDIITIIFVALAVLIFLRLRSVLGRRTGNERPPLERFQRREMPRAAGDKVVQLPPRPVRDGEPSVSTPDAAVDFDLKLKTIAPPGSALSESLRRMMNADRSFDPQQFLDGAKVAYEMVVTAFAEGDRRQLRSLLSREVYDGFVAAISDRESRGEKIEFRFVGVEKAEITDAALKGSTEQVTVRFTSQLISATKDRDGKVVDGDETKVSDVTDIWTFAREVSSRDPNWRLIATESVE